MKSKLTNEEITDFWIRCYLGDSSDHEKKCIDRAYLDLNRTIHGLGQKQTSEKYNSLVIYLKQELIIKILCSKFNTQNEFDIWHNNLCNDLCKKFENTYNNEIKFHYGQAQKWVNMTLKYLFAMGEKYFPNIKVNYIFFHIPIDNIILEKLSKLTENPIKKFNDSWSRIDYKIYNDYQNNVRKRFLNEIPLEIEFKLFNELK